MLPLLPIVQSGPVLGSGSQKSEAPLPCRAPVRTSFWPLPMGPHRLLPAPKWGPQVPSEALHWELPSHSLLFSSCPQLSLQSRPSRTQCLPPIATGLLPHSRSSCAQQPLKTKLGVSRERKHFQQKAPDFLFMFKPTEHGICQHLPGKHSHKGHRDSSFLGLLWGQSPRE